MSLIFLLSTLGVQAQDEHWTLEECIIYALKENIRVKQADLTGQRNELYSEQARAAKLPSLSGSVSQNFNWNKSLQTTSGQYGSLEGVNSTSYGLNSNMVLFNGMKLNNQEKQAELNLQSSYYYAETIKESIELSILEAFLQVLYAQENVTNAQKQIEATKEQLALAEERLTLGMISQSDYLQIKSQLAAEKLTLANAYSVQSIAKVSLMQLMELPVDDGFEIASPPLESLLEKQVQPKAFEIYQQALSIKPQIKMTDLDQQSARLEEKIAKASLLPSLSLNAGLGTNYSSLQPDFDYSSQLKNQISPSVGFSLSIPIFQNKQAQTSIGLAKIGITDAELEAINTRNELRKEIEQASVDALSAQSEYKASVEQFQAAQESNEVANEKYQIGLMNSVDYLFEKTNLITAESELLQSKYRLLFAAKILDFYKGIPLTL